MPNKENLLAIQLSECPNPTDNIVYPPVIEYNFSWDETGMKLADLWVSFEIAFCEKKAADCQDELYSFIDLFLDTYQDWQPKEMADSRLYVSEYRKSTGDYKHCIATEASLSIGHPFRFIRGFMNWIKCMSVDYSTVRDFHKIERMIEIITRSPHNRVLLRCNQFQSVLLGWSNDLSNALSSFVSSDGSFIASNDKVENTFLSLKNLIAIIYNFLPSLEKASWLTLPSAFHSSSSNLLPILNSVFGSFSNYSLEGHEECLIDVTWELTVLLAKVYDLICTHSFSQDWICLFHQLILITADSITLSKDVTRSVKVLSLIHQITKNLGSWLFGKSPVNQLKEEELLSLNVDLTILLITACNVNDMTRKEAVRLECYQMINQVFVYLIKNALVKKMIHVQLPEKREALSISTPLQYHMIEMGLAKLTPTLFCPPASSITNSWNLMNQIEQLSLAGIDNTFIDVLSRFIIASVIGNSVNEELFESYLITFHNIELFSDEDRNVVECLLLSVLHSMCRLQPSLYSFCLSKHIISSLLSSKFLMKVDCTHFINQEEKSLIQSINQDQDGHDIITIFVRYHVLNFIFELLVHATPEVRCTEIVSLLNAMVTESFDELCVMDICSRLNEVVINNLDLLKSTKLPQYLIYFIFHMKSTSPLVWPAKYSILLLLDSILNHTEVLVDLILTMGVTIDNSLKNTMEDLFNLIDSEKTVDFGAAFIIDILLTATNNELVNDSYFSEIMNIFVNMGTSLSRIHSPVFDKKNSYLMHMLFNIVDYMLLENRLTNPQLTHKRQDILCKTNFVIHCFSIITTTCQNDAYFSVVYHMLFTLFLMLHDNPSFYQEFRHTVQDDQFTNVLTIQNHQYDLFLIESLLNILVDRFVFNTFSFYNDFPAFKEYVMKIISEEETMGCMNDFATTLNKKVLLDSIRIVRPDFLGILLYFILRTEEDLQRNCLLFIKALLESKNCQLNLIAITSQSKGLVDMLLNHLEEFAAKNIELVLEIIQCVAKHNITVQQLKKVFRLLHPQNNHRACYAQQILMMLNDLYSTADSHKPDHSFLLVPPSSGIQITSSIQYPNQPKSTLVEGIHRFPGNGYTLSLWFNVASFYADWIMEGEFAVPHLFSIIDKDNAFLVYIQNASLVIKYYQNGKEVEIPATNLPILDNQWYHIVISQSYRHMSKVHPLFVSINGECNFECNCVYPSFSLHPQVYIGTRGIDLVYTQIPTAYTDFKGELGTMYMFNKAVDKTQAKGMYLLGPNYMFNFESLSIENRPIFEVSTFSSTDRTAITTVCNNSLTSSILMNLSASVIDNETKSIFDNTPPYYRQQKWANTVMGVAVTKDTKDQGIIQSVNGTLLSGTYVCLTKQIPSVLDSLGGISLFFPLIPQLDLFEANSNEAQFAKEFTEQCYKLICNAVMKSTSSQLFMTQKNGFDILAYLLQKTCPTNLTEFLLSQLISLIQQPSLSIDLQKQIFKAFILNSSLWIYSPFTLQKQLYEYILSTLQQGENHGLIDLIKGIGIEGYCHIIRYSYCNMEIEMSDELGDERQILHQWLAMDEEYHHPITNAVVATKLNADEKKEIRSILMNIIMELLKDSSSISESGCYYIANSILWCSRNKDMELMLTFLELLDSILHKDDYGVLFIKKMAGFSHVSLNIDGKSCFQPVPEKITEVATLKAGVLPLFLTLFTLNDQRVTVATLKMILYIISLCEKVTDGSLWLAFGISRENSHIIMDFIASHCTIVMIDESMIRSILIQMMGDSTLEENDNLTIQSTPLIPLFLQLLPLLSQDCILKYYTLFIDIFSNIQSTLNIKQFLHVPFWYNYIFSFVTRIREEKKELMDSLWSHLQNLLVYLISAATEKYLYASNTTIPTIRQDKEALQLLTIVFSAIKHYIGDNSVMNSYDRGFFADFFILVVNRIVATLGMPGDKTCFLVTIEPVLQYLYQLLVFMIELPIDEDEVEVERDHYQWQLISPFHTLITSIIETISRMNPDIRKQVNIDVFKKTCYTYDLSLFLILLGHYNLIINDHCASNEDEAISPDVSTLLGGMSNQPTTIPSTTSALDDLLGGNTVNQPSAIDDLLGSAPAQPTSDLLGSAPAQPSPIQSASDLLGNAPAQPTSDLLGYPQATQASQSATSIDDLLGLPTIQPPANGDALLGVPSSTSVSPILVNTPMEEKYKPLYNEAILIAKQLKLVVSNNELPVDNIVYLSHLNDAIRTLINESSLITADDFKATLIEVGNVILSRIEERAREILKQVDELKPKRKWLLSDKKKEEIEKYTAIGKELNDMLILPPECWADKNTHLYKAIELLQLKDTSALAIPFDQIKQQVEASFNSILIYTLNSAYASSIIDYTIGCVLLQEKNFEVHCLKDGSHDFWRKHQMIVKKWSIMVESLVHERGPWGELKEDNGILTLTLRCNEMGMHNIIVKDPEGSTHPDASVWNEEKNQEIKEKPKMMNIIESSIDKENEMKEIDQEFLNTTSHKSHIVFSEDCYMITPMLATRGKLDLSDNTISFTVNADFEHEFKEQIEKQAKLMENNKRIEGINKFTMLTLPENKIWKLTELVSEEYRMYLFRNTAVELFFQDSTSYFFSFPSVAIRDTFHATLRKQITPNLTEFLGATPAERYAKDDSTRRWLNREMSTFEYLMRLNRLAGRTYNDLSQYYVFPWVIADYTSDTIDLRNPAIYRQFDYPMGAQLEYRREALKDKYDIMKENFASRSTDMQDPLGILCPPPRYFSTHYSNSANVLWYLIRLEPYTSLHIFLQDGKFDRPDRQFWSMKNTYNGCTTNDGDVKELIPEFYYLPDFLKNANHINLGIRQDSPVPINDVQLPPWAKTPEEFIRINREALESEYVSLNIHKWIDLIFGYKQKGPEAEACYNVFSHVTYYGALDMEWLSHNSQVDWQQAADMLENFGQTPLQLMNIPHKSRRPLMNIPNQPLLSYRDWITPLGCHYLGSMTSKVYTQQSLMLYDTNMKLSSPALACATNPLTGNMMILTQNRQLLNNPIKQVNGGKITPADIMIDPLMKTNRCPIIGEPFSPLHSMKKACLESDQLVRFFHNDAYVCICGCWDESVKIINLTTGIVELSLSSNQDIVTCMDISQDDSILATGSLNNTVVLYYLAKKDGHLIVRRKKVLFGHDGGVTCISIHKELNLLCSGSKDGTIIVYSLADACYLRTICDLDYDKKLPMMPPISWCGITNNGSIIWYSQLDFKFHYYSLLGQKIYEKEMNSQLNSITLSNDREYVIAAGDKITLFLMRIYDFALVTPTIREHFGGEGKPAAFTQLPNLHKAVRSVRTSRDEQFIFLGLENGSIFVVASTTKN